MQGKIIMSTNSAKVAKERLSRITFNDWMERVNLLLEIDGRKTTEFPELYWRGYYGAGLAPGHVAEVVIGVHGPAKDRRAARKSV